MCQSHTLCRITDQISCHKGVLHTCMSHCNSVADCDRRKDDRSTACHCNTHLYCIYDLINIHMTRNDLIVRAYDTNQRLLQLFLCNSECIKQRTLWRCCHSLFYCITSHLLSPCLSYIHIPIRNRTNCYLYSMIYPIRSAIRSPIFVVPTRVLPSSMMSTVR